MMNQLSAVEKQNEIKAKLKRAFTRIDEGIKSIALNHFRKARYCKVSCVLLNFGMS